MLAQQLSAAQESAATPHEGVDSAGIVAAYLDEEGRLRDLVVARDWRHHVEPDGLDDVVREAVTAALSARSETFGAAFQAQEDGLPPLPRRAAAAQPDLSERLAQAAAADGGNAAFTGLADLLAEVNRSLDQLDRHVEAAITARHNGRSRAGHVTATVTAAGDITGIRYDLRWLVKAHEYNIGRETVDAVRAAVETAGRHSVEQAVSASPFGQFLRVVNDPAAFVHRVRS